MGQTVLFFATLAFTILIGLKANINLGVVGIAMSFLLGQFCLQMSASEVILQFPTALFFVLFITTMFYGFANENGVLEGISLRLIQRFSHMEWTVPFLLFLSAATVSALGAGAMATPVIISPIAFSMAQRFCFHPLIASVGIWCGTMLGDSMPWSATYQSNLARYQVFFDSDTVTQALICKTWWSLVLFPLTFLGIYFIWRKKSVSCGTENIPDAAPFTKQQKLTLQVIIFVIICVLLPGILGLLFPSPVISLLQERLSIQLLTSVGTVILILFNAADFAQVLQKRVPWNMILTICGLTMLMSFSNRMGVLETMSAFVLFITTMFYGFANENGVLEGISLRLIQRFSHMEWTVPFLLFLSAATVSALGAGAMATPVIISPIAFSMAQRFCFHPLIASVGIWCGTMLGDSMPWSATYQSNLARYQVFFDSDTVTQALICKTWWSLVLFPLTFLGIYFIWRKKSVSCGTENIPDAAPFTKQQKLTLQVIIFVIICVLLPGILGLLFPSPVISLLQERLSIQLLTSVGTVILILFNAADFAQVLQKRVPWNMILTICGLTMLMSFSNRMGVLETMSALIGTWLPKKAILPILILLIGSLTYFLDGRAISSLMIPLLPALVQASGYEAEELIIAYMFAGAIPSISPFSTGGAMALSGCSEERARTCCIRQQMYLPWPLLIVLTLLGSAGIFGFAL